MNFKNFAFRLTNLFILSVLMLGSLFSLPQITQAQVTCSGVTDGKTRAQLEAEQVVCEQEEAEFTKMKASLDQQSASYQNDVATLTAKINAAQANIKAKNIAITNLAKDIATKQSQISVLDQRIEKGKQAIAQIIRKTNDLNSYSLAEAILSNKDLSEFFVDIDTYSSTENALDILFNDLRNTRALTETEKAALNKKKEQEDSAKAALEASKKQVEVANNEKKTLLAQSQNQAAAYAKLVADRQAKAAQIRAVLFPLRDAGAIQFGTALQYADAASSATGVPSALILAILQQESNLGANVGSCVITNLSSGESKSVKTGQTFSNGIHPTRDLPVFRDILSSLGGDPLTTKVSCPIAGIAGYGGAMGPAQFIPSTWKLIAGKVGGALNKSTPNPWEPQDAIMAMGYFLKGLIGTTGDPYTDQRTAACRYYSGKTCYGSNGANVGLSYGNSVMRRVADIQDDIDFLRGA